MKKIVSALLVFSFLFVIICCAYFPNYSLAASVQAAKSIFRPVYKAIDYSTAAVYTLLGLNEDRIENEAFFADLYSPGSSLNVEYTNKFYEYCKTNNLTFWDGKTISGYDFPVFKCKLHLIIDGEIFDYRVIYYPYMNKIVGVYLLTTFNYQLVVGDDLLSKLPLWEFWNVPNCYEGEISVIL